MHCHPLIHFTNKINEYLNNNSFNLKIFIDLNKALDTIKFDILLDQLNIVELKNYEKIWFTNYSPNRVHFVQLPCGTLSDE